MNQQVFHSMFQGGFPFWLISTFGLVIVVFALWSIAWKGLALWHAARLGHKGWFVILLVINTAGILEIIYIFLVIKKKPWPIETEPVGDKTNQ